MRSRLDDLPVYDVRPSSVSAADYNLVQIALHRIENPMRFELPSLRTLDLILEVDAWIVVDRSLNDIPVIAWIDFKDHHRQNLHEPVDCERRIYHSHATKIIHKINNGMIQILRRKLEEISPAGTDKILPIKKPS